MAGRPKELFNPGELSRTRKNLGNLSPDEAKRMAEIEAAKKELAKEIKAEKEKILAELSGSKEEVKKLVENKIRNAA